MKINRTAIRALGETLFLFGMIGFLYGIAVQFFREGWLTGKLSHLTPWLRVDTFTIASFFVSAAGFFIWRLLKND